MIRYTNIKKITSKTFNEKYHTFRDTIVHKCLFCNKPMLCEPNSFYEFNDINSYQAYAVICSDLCLNMWVLKYNV
jgi:hypothetical protein